MFEPFARGGDGRMVGQAEVIIGAEVERRRAVLDPHAGRLRCGDDPFGLVKALRAQFIQLARELFFNCPEHKVTGSPATPARNARGKSLLVA
jgi:hypothetical protein